MVYRLSASFPSSEKYGMTVQVRRSACSIAANISEGASRRGAREFLQFLGIASGSLAETETFLILASRLGMANCEHIDDVLVCADEVGKMLTGLKRSVRRQLATTD
ncbi:MAG: four helix bundle protein [Acidimicrobiia bacterium]|nr:four helix bundle protein [Acidimicrobiia bacterium]